jgi:hypothetical protein
MIKKFIVSMALLGTAIAAQANITILSWFYIDQVDDAVGGYSTVHWDDGSQTWANHFAVYVAPSASIVGSLDPDYTIQNWITPVANGGANFQGVELFARWGPNSEVFASSMGNGADLSSIGFNMIDFSGTNASWNVQLYTPVVTSVPEPESYALMLASLGILAAVRQKNSKKTG